MNFAENALVASDLNVNFGGKQTTIPESYITNDVKFSWVMVLNSKLVIFNGCISKMVTSHRSITKMILSMTRQTDSKSIQQKTKINCWKQRWFKVMLQICMIREDCFIPSWIYANKKGKTFYQVSQRSIWSLCSANNITSSTKNQRLFNIWLKVRSYLFAVSKMPSRNDRERHWIHMELFHLGKLTIVKKKIYNNNKYNIKISLSKDNLPGVQYNAKLLKNYSNN